MYKTINKSVPELVRVNKANPKFLKKEESIYSQKNIYKKKVNQL
jgi:hypothetical protein